MKGYVDDKGCLTLVGPCKEMDINGGYNVYPLEIVNIPAQHPAVSIAAVIGVPDDIEGEVGWAFLMKKTGSGTTEEELKNFCKARMMIARRLHGVSLKKPFPWQAWERSMR